MFIFSKIFRLASLANQDASKKEIYKSNYFTSFIKKSFCVSLKHSEGMQPTSQHPIPFMNFQNNWFYI